MVIFHSYVSLPEGNQLHPDVKVSYNGDIETIYDVDLSAGGVYIHNVAWPKEGRCCAVSPD